MFSRSPPPPPPFLGYRAASFPFSSIYSTRLDMTRYSNNDVYLVHYFFLDMVRSRTSLCQYQWTMGMMRKNYQASYKMILLSMNLDLNDLEYPPLKPTVGQGDQFEGTVCMPVTI